MGLYLGDNEISNAGGGGVRPYVIELEHNGTLSHINRLFFNHSDGKWYKNYACTVPVTKIEVPEKFYSVRFVNMQGGSSVERIKSSFAFNGFAGTGTTSAVTISEDGTISGVPTNDGTLTALWSETPEEIVLPKSNRYSYRLLGWRDNNLGESIIGEVGEIFVPTADIDLCPVWQFDYTTTGNVRFAGKNLAVVSLTLPATLQGKLQATSVSGLQAGDNINEIDIASLEWSEVKAGDVVVGQVIYLRGSNRANSLFNASDEANALHIVCEGGFYADGDINALIDYVQSSKGVSVEIGAFAFDHLFYNNKDILTTPALTITTTYKSVRACYAMFKDCSNLEALSRRFRLLATSLAYECFMSMCEGCGKLKALPNGFTFPACSMDATTYTEAYKDNITYYEWTNKTTVYNGVTNTSTANPTTKTGKPTEIRVAVPIRCYARMFALTGLESLPAHFTLPATKPAQEAYAYMFYKSKLKSLPENMRIGQWTDVEYKTFEAKIVTLKTTLKTPNNKTFDNVNVFGYKTVTVGATAVCEYMFAECYDLVSIPKDLFKNAILPDYCCRGMFMCCHNLQLPKGFTFYVNKLSIGCLMQTFAYCENMTYPALFTNLQPEQTIGRIGYEYAGMYEGCDKLPALSYKHTAETPVLFFKKHASIGDRNTFLGMYKGITVNAFNDETLMEWWRSLQDSERQNLLKMFGKDYANNDTYSADPFLDNYHGAICEREADMGVAKRYWISSYYNKWEDIPAEEQAFIQAKKDNGTIIGWEFLSDIKEHKQLTQRYTKISTDTTLQTLYLAYAWANLSEAQKKKFLQSVGCRIEGKDNDWDGYDDKQRGAAFPGSKTKSIVYYTFERMSVFSMVYDEHFNDWKLTGIKLTNGTNATRNVTSATYDQHHNTTPIVENSGFWRFMADDKQTILSLMTWLQENGNNAYYLPEQTEETETNEQP